MAGRLFRQPPRAQDDLGHLLPGAALAFYATGTLDPQPVFGDPERTVELPNPLISDLAGRFTVFWMDENAPARAILTYEGVEIFDIDPVESFPGTDDGLPLDDAGRVMPGAVLTFWGAHTTELGEIFADENLTTPLANPQAANVAGQLVPIYFNDARSYRVRFADEAGCLVFDIDNYERLLPVIFPPGAPSLSGDIEDVEGDIQVNLDWTAATPGSLPIDHYEIFRSVDGGAFAFLASVDAADPLHYDNNGLAEDVIYRYFVVAVDEDANSGPNSNTVELAVSNSVFPVAGWVNPGAELTTITGWTSTLGSMTTRGPNVRFPPVGAWIFFGGTSASSKMFQRFDVLATGVSAVDVDAGDTQLVIDWWGGTFVQSPADQPAINMRFLNAALGVISSATSGYKNPATLYGTNIRWDPYTETQPIPALCRHIEIELEAKRNNGSNNDASFDEVVPRIEVIP